MVVTPVDVLPATETHLPIRKILSVGIGNALEFYDFMVFAFFAMQIARTFLPESQTSSGLLFSLAVFGFGFFTRPLGAIVVDYYGDRVGRKPAMILSFALMGISVVGLPTPSYTQIGIAAPILLLLFRLLQGFALGGEVGPSTAFLIEAAPPHQRGLYVSIQQASQGVAILTAGIVGFLVTSLLTAESLQACGWRVAFLFGAAIVPVGVYIRRQLPETLEDQSSLVATTMKKPHGHLRSAGFLSC
jgi:MFS family permease